MVRLLYISSEFYLAHGGVQTGLFFFSEGLFIFFFFTFFVVKMNMFLFSLSLNRKLQFITFLQNSLV